MTASAFDILAIFAVNITVAITTAIVTVHLSIRRFRTEKWWEIRAEAYHRVIEALHNAKAFSDTHLKADMEDLAISPEREKEVSEQSEKAVREITHAIDLGRYLLSKEALDRLKRYQTDRAAAADTTSWQRYLMDTRDVCEDCLKDMSKIARRELKIKN